jgi:hypothetical protein
MITEIKRDKNTKKGKVTICNSPELPQPHEIATVEFLISFGFDIEFLIPSYSQGIKNPDIKMKGHNWEIKAPKKHGKYTIQHCCRTAQKQSEYIIFDLRSLKVNDNNSISEIKKQFSIMRKIKIILIITKCNSLIALER